MNDMRTRIIRESREHWSQLSESFKHIHRDSLEIFPKPFRIIFVPKKILKVTADDQAFFEETIKSRMVQIHVLHALGAEIPDALPNTNDYTFTAFHFFCEAMVQTCDTKNDRFFEDIETLREEKTSEVFDSLISKEHPPFLRESWWEDCFSNMYSHGLKMKVTADHRTFSCQRLKIRYNG